MDIPAPAPLSDLSSSTPPLHVRLPSPQPATPSPLQNTHIPDVPPPTIGTPSTDAVMQSPAPTRRAGMISEDYPLPIPRQTDQCPRVLSLSDFIETPAASRGSLGSRVSHGRDFSRPSLLLGGNCDGEGGKAKTAPEEGRAPNMERARKVYLIRGKDS